MNLDLLRRWLHILRSHNFRIIINTEILRRPFEIGQTLHRDIIATVYTDNDVVNDDVVVNDDDDDDGEEEEVLNISFSYWSRLQHVNIIWKFYLLIAYAHSFKRGLDARCCKYINFLNNCLLLVLVELL